MTGASGFLGVALGRRLREAGSVVLGMARNVSAGVSNIIPGDVSNRIDVENALRWAQPTHVFHLAANRRRDEPLPTLAEAMTVNALGVVNVVTCAAAAGCQRVLVVGTADEYGPITAPFGEDDREWPTTVYGISKLAGTRSSLGAGSVGGIGVTVVRPTVAYGPGQATDMFVPALLRALLSGSRFPMTDGTQTRDFIFIDDLVEGIICAAASPDTAGLIVNLGSGHPTTVRVVAELSQHIAGRSALLDFGGLRRRQGEAHDYSVKLSRAATLCGWRAHVPLEDGLQRTIRSLME